MRNYIFALMALLPLANYSQDKSFIESLLPAGGAEGFSISGSPEFFFGDELYSYINGGADIYLEYGIEAAASAYYQDTENNKIHIEIYQMQDKDAAFGIYSINSGKPVSPVLKGCESSDHGSYVDLWKNKAFVRISEVSGENESHPDVIRKMAEIVCSKKSAKNDFPELLRTAESSGIDLGSPKYFKGLVALNNIYSFGAGTIFGFDEGIAGEYNGKRLMLFRYKDDKTRYEWVQNGRGKIRNIRKFSDFMDQDGGFSAVDREGKQVNFKEFGRYLLVVFDMDWQEVVSLSKVLEKYFK